jgi:hypothetical protein
MAIVQEKVKPQRDRDNRDVRRKYWWRFAETTPALYAAIAGLDRVLVISRIGNAFGFTCLPVGIIFNEKIVVFPFSTLSPFGTLQSRLHEVWARFLSSTLKDDLQYTPSACFETFPFPRDYESNDALEAAGREYYEFRAALMVRNNEGLTKTYNRFHDPHEQSADIMKLRELHAAMDDAVLRAYGWDDLADRATCEFLLDYQENDDENASTKSKKKKPWRYRWPDDFRDEVLARLLELNKQRHEEERLAGLANIASAKVKIPRKEKNLSDPAQKRLIG